MSEAILRVEDLRKTYRKMPFTQGHEALRGVDIEVGRGQVFGLLGPNGAGKTTLIKILLGLVRGTGGRAEMFGEPVGKPAPRSRVGYLPEAHRMPAYLTGAQVLRLFGQLCGRDPKWLDERIPTWLKRVGMLEDAHRKIREYSKGMQQRIGLAQALIHEPELIFLDEPTDGVDPVGRKEIRGIIQELSERGTTVFINSHLLVEVQMMCERVVIMDKGRIIKEGSTEELTRETGVVRFEIGRYPANLKSILPPDIGEISEIPPNDGDTVREGHFDVTVEPERIDAIVDALRANDVSIRGIDPGKNTLEDTFIALIGEDRK